MNLLKLPNVGANIAAGTIGQIVRFQKAPRNLAIQGSITVDSGGGTFDVYVQTSLDGGNTWWDVCNFHFTTLTVAAVQFNLSNATPVTTQRTPTNGSIAANTSIDGMLGPMFRTSYKSAGTAYGGATVVSVDFATDDTPN